MTRVTVAGLVLGIILAPLTWSVLAARQQPNQPGMPTIARTYILNSEPGDAVPVRLVSGTDVQPVTIMAPVTLAPTTVVATRVSRQFWEYRQITVAAGADGVAALNAAGADGWEAVAMTSAGSSGSTVILKRVR